MGQDLSVVVPVRIADLGGWTDTWFAGHGAVCHLAVEPGIEVRVTTTGMTSMPRVVVDADDFGERFVLPDDGEFAGRHALLAAALDAARSDRAVSCDVRVRSAVPPGASMGTSAALVVAVLAAFDELAGVPLSPGDLARRAHDVEVCSLGQESGVQDQIAAAYGGALFVAIPRYPETLVETLALDEATQTALDARLLVFFLGRAHTSSAVHREVIASLGADGPRHRALERLRDLARQGRAALISGDLIAYGRALSDNCDAQSALHPSLVSPVASRVIAVARAAGAIGWKVNGAGGDGGSVTVLCDGADGARDRLARAVVAAVDGVRVIPVRLSRSGARRR